MALDATVGTTTANSYVTLAEANAYFSSILNKPLWTGLDLVKEQSLIQATSELDIYFEWIGIIKSVTQSLAWPRKSFGFVGSEITNSDISIGYQLDHNPLDGLTIPNSLKLAVYELAYVLISGGYELSESDVSEIKVGPIQIKFDSQLKEIGFPKKVIQILKRIGTILVSGPNSITNIRLIRS